MSTGDRQSGEELEAHMGPGGPVAAARAFLEVVLDEADVHRACALMWAKMDANLRLVRAQGWIWANRTHADIAARDRDELAQALAAERPEDPLWPEFVVLELERLRSDLSPFHPRAAGAASRPRPIGPDLELVIFIPTDGKIIEVTSPTVADALGILMRSTSDGWRVAGFDREPPKPEWPPEP